MSDSMHTSKGRPRDEIRAVRVMVDELRAQPAPDFAWDAMEQRLLTRIAERSAVAMLCRPAPPPSMFGRFAAFAVAAAAIAFGVASTGSSSSMPSEASSAAAPRTGRTVDATTVAWASGPSDGSGPAHDLSALRVGDEVEARQAPVSFAEAGLVRWTLQPGSALRVRSVGLGHTVELERGSLRAEVTPRDPSEGMVEAFAVEVGGTRVAVHGTAFSVQVEDGRVVVDVEHGAVAVGPIGYAGTTTGHLLVGPSRGSFSLDGGRVARLLDRPLVSQPVIASRGAEARPDPGAGGDAIVARGGADGHTDDATNAKRADAVGAHADRAGSSGRPASPGGAKTPSGETGETTEVPRLTAEIVRGRLDRCFRHAFDTAPSALESVSSTLSIDLNPDGTVRAARFNPPLTGALTSCAGGAIAGRFADDTGHLEIPVAFRP